MDWDFDFDVSLTRVLTALSLLLGSILFILYWSTSLTDLPFILPLSLILLATGIVQVVREVRERSQYEAIIPSPISSLDQSHRLKKLEESFATFERLCLRDLAELKSRVEMLEKERATIISQEGTVEHLPSEPSSTTTSEGPQLEKPTKDQLATLKQKLSIEKGSLQYKDSSIYLVTSNKETKKHVWQKLGKWKDLVNSLKS